MNYSDSLLFHDGNMECSNTEAALRWGDVLIRSQPKAIP
jgi:hypothetical protein